MFDVPAKKSRVFDVPAKKSRVFDALANKLECFIFQQNKLECMLLKQNKLLLVTGSHFQPSQILVTNTVKEGKSGVSHSQILD